MSKNKKNGKNFDLDKAIETTKKVAGVAGTVIGLASAAVGLINQMKNNGNA